MLWTKDQMNNKILCFNNLSKFIFRGFFRIQKLKNRFLFSQLFLLLFMLSSCNETLAIIPTDTQVPTAIPTDTPTPVPTKTRDWVYVDHRYCDGVLPVNWRETWSKNGFILTNWESTLEDLPYERYSLVILPIPHSYKEKFSSKDIDAIVDYVKNGGHLFLISKFYSGGGNSTKQANMISSKFGVTFINRILEASKEGVVSYPVNQHPITKGIKYYVVRHQPCVIEIDNSDVTPLLENSYGQILLAATNYGKGKVVFLAEIEGLGYSKVESGYSNNLLNNIAKWFKTD